MTSCTICNHPHKSSLIIHFPWVAAAAALVFSSTKSCWFSSANSFWFVAFAVVSDYPNNHPSCCFSLSILDLDESMNIVISFNVHILQCKAHTTANSLTLLVKPWCDLGLNHLSWYTSSRALCSGNKNLLVVLRLRESILFYCICIVFIF